MSKIRICQNIFVINKEDSQRILSKNNKDLAKMEKLLCAAMNQRFTSIYMGLKYQTKANLNCP